MGEIGCDLSSYHVYCQCYRLQNVINGSFFVPADNSKTVIVQAKHLSALGKFY